MEEQHQSSSSASGQSAEDQSAQSQSAEAKSSQASGETSSADQLLEEMSRLGRKLVEVAETAWHSEQRKQVQEEIRTGLNSIAESIETGIQDVSKKEQTKEVIGKAEEVADDVVEKVRANEFANELAAGLASVFHALANRLDKVSQEIRSSQPPKDRSTTTEKPSETTAQDIPITEDKPESTGSDY